MLFRSFDKPVEVAGTAELQADEGGAGFPVVAFEVFEKGDVVVGAENVTEEGPELAGFLDYTVGVYEQE